MLTIKSENFKKSFDFLTKSLFLGQFQLFFVEENTKFSEKKI